VGEQKLIYKYESEGEEGSGGEMLEESYEPGGAADYIKGI